MVKIRNNNKPLFYFSYLLLTYLGQNKLIILKVKSIQVSKLNHTKDNLETWARRECLKINKNNGKYYVKDNL